MAKRVVTPKEDPAKTWDVWIGVAALAVVLFGVLLTLSSMVSFSADSEVERIFIRDVAGQCYSIEAVGKQHGGRLIRSVDDKNCYAFSREASK